MVKTWKERKNPQSLMHDITVKVIVLLSIRTRNVECLILHLLYNIILCLHHTFQFIFERAGRAKLFLIVRGRSYLWDVEARRVG